MEDQFLNLKKCKNKALGEADTQVDAILDPRIFYDCAVDEDQHFEEAFILKHRNQDRPETSNNKKKRKYVSKEDLDKEKPAIAQENQSFYFQELNLIHSILHSKLNYDHFEDKLRTIANNEEVAKFNTIRGKLNKRQIKPDQFFEEYLKIMKNVSLKVAYLIFPHYLRTVTNENLWYELN